MQVQIPLQPSTDLLWTPVVLEEHSGKAQYRLADSSLVAAATFVGQILRSLGAIPSPEGVAAQFSADGGFMNPETLGDVGNREAGFDKVFYQVPLLLGKLRVCVH